MESSEQLALGLNEHHQNQIVQYMRFMRYMRGLRLRSVDACFTDVIQTQLQMDTTFTREEVSCGMAGLGYGIQIRRHIPTPQSSDKRTTLLSVPVPLMPVPMPIFFANQVIEILNNLKSIVHTDTETELLNAAHTNVLLLRQMCGQAEKWHLKLVADISELENRELLDAIQSFEEHQFNMKQGEKLNVTVLKRLEPLEGGGAAPLLQVCSAHGEYGDSCVCQTFDFRRKLIA